MSFVCTACRAETNAAGDACPSCGRFMTMVEQRAGMVDPFPAHAALAAAAESAPKDPPRPLSEIARDVEEPKLPTGLPAFDRITGGGLSRGQFVLLAGDPGAGKSTLTMQLLRSQLNARAGVDKVLYATAEERCSALAARARRLGEIPPNLHAMFQSDLSRILSAAIDVGPQVLVVDSMQVVMLPDAGGAAGSAGQVLACGTALMNFAKATGTIVLAIAQILKDGDVAGPKALEHAVDTSLYLSLDENTGERCLMKSKDRYAPTGRSERFTMTELGLQELPE